MENNYYSVENPDGSTKAYYTNETYDLTINLNMQTGSADINVDLRKNNVNDITKQFIHDLTETNIELHKTKIALNAYQAVFKELIQKDMLPKELTTVLHSALESVDKEIFSKEENTTHRHKV